MKDKDKPEKIYLKKNLDCRGYLSEIYNFSKFNFYIKRSVISFSKKNVIRGLHFSNTKEARVVYVQQGEINDYCIELKKNPKVKKFNLKQNQALYIPSNYAHGYECLAKDNIIIYFLQNEYNPINNKGIIWNDKFLRLKWKVKKPLISKNDSKLPEFRQILKKWK